MENKKIKGQEKKPNTIAQQQAEESEIIKKFQNEIDRFKTKVLKLENDLLKEQNKNLKLNRKILELQEENRKSKSFPHDIHPVDLSLYSRPPALAVEDQERIEQFVKGD